MWVHKKPILNLNLYSTALCLKNQHSYYEIFFSSFFPVVICVKGTEKNSLWASGYNYWFLFPKENPPFYRK